MVSTSVSVGLASFPEDGSDAREIVVKADHEMYRHKELRKPSVEQA
jgi:GGDEF domain-containing protein